MHAGCAKQIPLYGFESSFILALRNSSPRLAPDTAYTSRAAPPSRVRSSAPTTHLPPPGPRSPPAHPPIPRRGDRDPTPCPALTAGTRTARRPPCPAPSKTQISPTSSGLADHHRTAPHWVRTPAERRVG
ncbi:hypothetical protein GQ55_9G192700 [Panicum hallii var. hallii]|uniref:Uncharacterized protein n=1 Tax=Panicum hallii var. hallii TaxID=1504633 RepID=A0A2T7C4X6_9POAL|nr:hypothetical protein GQ55_9G192700 [Panicum hallii var. hallii]